MPYYKLIYFDIRGHGELIRLLLHAGGVDFVDQRITMEEWPKLQNTMPMKMVPVLEVDGFKMSQSIAIALYLAKEFGFYGNTNKEQFKIDEVLHFAADLQPKFGKAYFEEDPEIKGEMSEEFTTKILPHFLDVFERDLIASKSGFIVGDKLTVADLALFEIMIGPMHMCPDLFRQYPKVLTHHRKIEGHPKVAEYIASRPFSVV